MITLGHIVTTTLMVLVAAGLYRLSSDSVCHSQKWRAEVTRTSLELTDRAAPRALPLRCSGGRVSWNFPGSFYARQ